VADAAPNPPPAARPVGQTYSCKLLVPESQIAGVMGDDNADALEDATTTGAEISLLPIEERPGCALVGSCQPVI